MGVEVEITNVNVEASSVTFTQDGESRTLQVVLPAQIKWAKLGKAEVGVNNDGKVNFVKSLEPRHANGFGGQKVAPKFRAVSSVEVLEKVTLKEFKSMYDMVNTMQDKKCGASNLFQRKDDTYDAVLYVTTFVPIGSVLDENLQQSA